MKSSHGHLVIVGGHEDREGDKPVLQRFVELLPSRDGPVYVLTAATEEPEQAWQQYEEAFGDLGVKDLRPLHVGEREHANDRALWEPVRDARGIFMTGGDQKKLISVLGGTRLCDVLRHVYIQQAACVGGTSAGASAFSEHMLSEVGEDDNPLTSEVRLTAGLGFVLNAIIDQHFSQRGRLVRLLAAVAHNPKLCGVGIDEDTGLVISRGKGIEVIGTGAVTLVDGREMRTRIVESADREVFRVSDVGLHMLPAGDRLDWSPEPQDESRAEEAGYSRGLQSLVKILVGEDAVDTQFRSTEATG